MELAPWHWVLLIVVAILLFGSKKLPELGKGLGEGFKGFKEGLKGVTDDTPKSTETAHAVTPKPETQVKPVASNVAARSETPVEEPVAK